MSHVLLLMAYVFNALSSLEYLPSFDIFETLSDVKTLILPLFYYNCHLKFFTYEFF